LRHGDVERLYTTLRYHREERHAVADAHRDILKPFVAPPISLWIKLCRFHPNTTA
jgi:hypothetical protein